MKLKEMEELLLAAEKAVRSGEVRKAIKILDAVERGASPDCESAAKKLRSWIEKESARLMSEARKLLSKKEPEGAVRLLEEIRDFMSGNKEFEDLLESALDGVQVKKAMLKEVSASKKQAADLLKSGDPERAAAILDAIAPYCSGDSGYKELVDRVEKELKKKQLEKQIDTIKRTASRYFDTGQISQALAELSRIRELSADPAVSREVDEILEWRFDSKVRAAQKALENYEIELAEKHIYFASQITEVARKRMAQLEELKSRLDRAARVVEAKKRVGALLGEKKLEEASRELGNILLLEPADQEAKQALASIKEIQSRKEKAWRVGNIFLKVALIALGLTLLSVFYFGLEIKKLGKLAELQHKKKYEEIVRSIEGSRFVPVFHRGEFRHVLGAAKYRLLIEKVLVAEKRGDFRSALSLLEEARPLAIESGSFERMAQQVAVKALQRAQALAAKAGKQREAEEIFAAINEALPPESNVFRESLKSRAELIKTQANDCIKRRSWAGAAEWALRAEELKKYEPAFGNEILRDVMKGMERRLTEIADLTESGGAVERSRSEILILQKENKKIMGELAKVEAELKSFRTRHSAEIEKLRRIGEWEKKRKKLKTDLDGYRATVKRINDKIKTEGSSYTQSSQFLENDKQLLEECQNRARQVFNKLEELEAAIEKESAGISEFRSRLDSLVMKRERLIASLMVNKQKIAKLNKRIKDIHSSMSSLIKEEDLIRDLLSKLKKTMRNGGSGETR